MRSELLPFGRVFRYAEQLVGGNAEKFGKGGKLRRVRQRFAPFEGGEPLRGYARMQGKAVPRKTAGKTLFRDFAADMIFFHLFVLPKNILRYHYIRECAGSQYRITFFVSF